MPEDIEALRARLKGCPQASPAQTLLQAQVDRFHYPDTTQHINPHSLSILDKQDGKGRGVYATHQLHRGTLVEISPVLVLSRDEYTRPGGVGETVLKDYVFTWDRQGQMAVALGLGSIFNHSSTPNVAFKLDRPGKAIHYTLTRDVQPAEELCIFYGAHARFGSGPDAELESEEETLDGTWDAFSNLVDPEEPSQSQLLATVATDVLDADSTEVVPFAQCPCVRVTDEVSLADLPLELADVWVSDVLAKDAPALFDSIRELRQARGWPVNYMCHLKRIKRLDPDRLAVLLLPPNGHDLDDALDFIASISNHPVLLSKPYQTAVPVRAAATREQLAAFNDVWPVNYVPIRVGVTAQILPKGLTRTHLDWAQTMVNRVERLAQEAERRGELPVASLVAASTLGPPLAEASDTRRSTGNLLCHSIANLIDQVAALDVRNARQAPGQPPPYLLSGLTLFTTHEPCMMCSMALLHSRIAAVYYVRAAPDAGGLGSVHSVHEDRGLNHKFEAWLWKGGRRPLPDLQADP